MPCSRVLRGARRGRAAAPSSAVSTTSGRSRPASARGACRVTTRDRRPAGVSGIDLFSGTPHFRRRSEGEEQKSTTLELFFDLVFVFAITQLSHSLLGDLTVAGGARTLFLLLVVWWAWTYT